MNISRKNLCTPVIENIKFFCTYGKFDITISNDHHNHSIISTDAVHSEEQVSYKQVCQKVDVGLAKRGGKREHRFTMQTLLN